MQAHYDSVITKIKDYNPPRQTRLLTPEVFVYNIKSYQTELFKHLDRNTKYIIIKDNTKIYETLFNLTILCLNHLQNTTSTPESEIISDNRTLFMKKNTDYGNSFEDFELIGILVRLNDKMNRIISLDKNQSQVVLDERSEDTINDLYNYGIIGLMFKEFDPNKINPTK